MLEGDGGIENDVGGEAEAGVTLGVLANGTASDAYT